MLLPTMRLQSRYRRLNPPLNNAPIVGQAGSLLTEDEAKRRKGR